MAALNIRPIFCKLCMMPSSLAPLHRPWEPIWKTWAPGKCHFFMWLAAHNKCLACTLRSPTSYSLPPLRSGGRNYQSSVSIMCLRENFGLFCCGKWVYRPLHHNKMNPPLMNGGPRQSQEWMIHTKKNSIRLSSLGHGQFGTIAIDAFFIVLLTWLEHCCSQVRNNVTGVLQRLREALLMSL